MKVDFATPSGTNTELAYRIPGILGIPGISGILGTRGIFSIPGIRGIAGILGMPATYPLVTYPPAA